MSRSKRELKLLLHPYFVIDILLSVMFHATKLVGPLCSLLYTECEIGFQDYEMLIFMGSFITLRRKRYSSVTDYVSHFCLFAKMVNLVMFWRQNSVYAIVYGVVWLLQACLMQQPTYEGPDKVFYLRDSTFEQEVINDDSKSTWLVAFYTAWSPACIKLQPMFAEMSEEYGLPNLKFCKLDIIRYPKLATKYNIDTSSFSNQLPTLIMFRHGREVTRRPAVFGTPPKKRTVQNFVFLWEKIINSFSLNEVYAECKKHTSGKQITKAVNQKTKKTN